jgi:hypothetical protein
MSGLAKAMILPVLVASLAQASDPDYYLLPAATMDPYLPIRNSALQFDLGVSHTSASSYYAGTSSDTTLNPGKNSGSTATDFENAASVTQFDLKIKHGFVANTEAIAELPFYMASGAAQRSKPASSDTSPVANGVGDLTLGIKSVYEPWGLGGYFGLLLPVGSDAYTHGDGQVNVGVLWDYTWNDMYTVMSNFVFGYNLPAVNGRLDQQHNWSGYLRFQGEFVDRKYRPYLAFQYVGRGEYSENDTVIADGGYQVMVTPGIDADIFGDFKAELSFPIVVAGYGNKYLATASGWGVNFTLKYFWFRF